MRDNDSFINFHKENGQHRSAMSRRRRDVAIHGDVERRPGAVSTALATSLYGSGDIASDAGTLCRMHKAVSEAIASDVASGL